MKKTATIDPTKPIELLVRFQCPDCSRLHSDEYEAEKCCPKDVEEMLVCPICEERFLSVFDKAEANEHMAKAHGTSIETVQERYMEELRYGRPMLGEWAFTMFADEDPEVRDSLIRI